MKKQMLTTIMTVVMLGTVLTGCGNTQETAAVTAAATQEATAASTEQVEETTEAVTEEVETTTEAVTETVSENEDDGVFTAEKGLAKVNRCIDAYNDLIASDKDLEWNILDRCERFKNVGSIVPKTSDGFELNPVEYSPYGGILCAQVAINYFYDYVNNNGSYYDFEDYITSHTADEILYSICDKESIEEQLEPCQPNNYLYDVVILSCNYLKNNTPLTTGEILEGENCTYKEVSNIPVQYEIPIFCNGSDENKFRAVFDKDGNLLNVCVPEEVDPRIFTFPTDEEIKAEPEKYSSAAAEKSE